MEEQKNIITRTKRLISNTDVWKNIVLTIFGMEAIIYAEDRWTVWPFIGGGFFLLCLLVEICFFQLSRSPEKRKGRKSLLLPLGFALAFNVFIAGLETFFR